MKILLHSSTKSAMEGFITGPSHALILEGPAGSGKFQASKLIAKEILKKDTIDNDPNVLVIEPEDGTVTIDQIRDAQKFMKLKTSGNATIRRILIVRIIRSITHEAQNAFLKLLEEPPKDTVIIITSESSSKLLGTVSSRAQLIKVLPIVLEVATVHYKKQGYAENQIIAAYNLSEAKSELMDGILSGEISDITSAIQDAKGFLGNDTYNRLINVTKYSKDKSELALFIRSLSIISGAGLKSAGANNQIDKLKRWHNASKESLKSSDYLSKNANAKLLSTYLSLYI